MAVDELARLFELAGQASQGSWHLDPEYRGWIFAEGKYIATTHRGRDSLVLPNSEYIAYASPERITRLLSNWRMWTVVDKPL